MSEVLFNLIVEFDNNTTSEFCFRDKKTAETYKELIENNKHTDTLVTISKSSGGFVNPQRVIALSIEEVDNADD